MELVAAGRRTVSTHAPGLVLMGALAILAVTSATLPVFAGNGIGVLTLAIAIGMIAAALLPDAVHGHAATGAQLAQRHLLRAGVALYGLRLTFQDVIATGPRGLIIDLAVVATILFTAWWIGTRVLGLDREIALLIGAGSGICGAAAVMAAEPVLRAPAHKVVIAVATVTVFGTVSVFLYPAMFPLLGLSPAQYGIYAGSTIHEVAQVVAAGNAVSAVAADQAVIVKLLRVLLLVPALAILGRLVSRGEDGQAAKRAPLVPGFLLAFVACVVVQSTHLLPPTLIAALLQLDTVLLALAMAALGWSARWKLLRSAGPRPLALGAILFGLLTVGGYALNRAVELLPL
jgi:uncharacterized integral membrane protein (TIGR00698 family)